MNILRTPDERFANLAGFPFEPRYATVSDPDGGRLRMHTSTRGRGMAPRS